MGTVNESAALDSAFIELVCQDDEFVRAEFDALIAACWHLPPPRPPATPRPAGDPPGGPPPPPWEVALPAGWRPARAGPRHQRSPPPKAR